MSHNQLLFGTAGTPISAKKRSSADGIRRIHELGLGCMELEFVHGVRMKEDTAQIVNQTATQEGVALSVHAPYYINLNSHEAEKVQASIQRIYESARIGALCGARSIVFHPGFYQKNDPEKVYTRIADHLIDLTRRLADEGIAATLRPETTGKATQFGDLEETLQMASQIEGVMPCIDFSHLHARSSGAYNSYEEFHGVLTRIEDKLGREGMEDMHIHISGIEYGPKGERKHLILEESDLHYNELLSALHDFDVRGLVICESPNLETDALLLQQNY